MQQQERPSAAAMQGRGEAPLSRYSIFDYDANEHDQVNLKSMMYGLFRAIGPLPGDADNFLVVSIFDEEQCL